MLLLATAAVWGVSFMVMKDVQEMIPMNYILAIRFGVAAIGLSYFLYKERDKFNWTLVKHGFIVGTFLYFAYAVQSYGLYFTTVSKNAVYSGLYVVLVPFMAWVIYRERIPIPVYLAAFLCFFGVFLIAGPISAEAFNYGDTLSLIGAFLFAAHMIAVARCSQTSELLPLCCLQFVFASAWGWIFAFSGKPFPSHLTPAAWGGLAWLAIMATLVAITMMNMGIKYVNPTVTAIIFSTESLFACLCGVLIKNDPMNGRIALGIALIFLSLVFSQIGGNNEISDAPNKNDSHATPDSPSSKSSNERERSAVRAR
ncbi:MAG: DMT family transporter [Candidatus Bruticola sp.]